MTCDLMHGRDFFFLMNFKCFRPGTSSGVQRGIYHLQSEDKIRIAASVYNSVCGLTAKQLNTPCTVDINRLIWIDCGELLIQTNLF